MNYQEEALKLHEANKGKLSIESKVRLDTKEDLSIAYTPGVAEPCRRIAANPEDVYKYTSKGNLVAVVTDGSAVLGLGNIGSAAGMPVMEGKALLFKNFAGVDAFPICLSTQDTEEIIATVKAISPGFGGINLEDIQAPRCFEIEERLQAELDIPIFHDDQHGTAIVVVAALINALKLTNGELKTTRVVINGAGAAGTAVVKMLLSLGVEDIILLDSKGIIEKTRTDCGVGYKKQLAEITNRKGLKGGLKEAIKGSHCFVGVSQANCLTPEMVKTMDENSIIFALANPVPEIMPEVAKAAGVKVIGTGRSDFPNQINNVLAFPGIFRGALDARAKKITEKMKLAAAYAIADLVSDQERTPDYIIPSPFDKRVAEAVAKAVMQAVEK